MYDTILYETEGPVAVLTLNRPDSLNTIVPPMTDELEDAVRTANRDESVKLMILQGAGRSLCAGFDFSQGFRQWDPELTTGGTWDPGKELVFATSPVSWVSKFMSLWRSPKPVIAQVHGWCVGGGSEMALCADIVIASEDARIGTPYSRMWGCHHACMWVYRLGLARAKELALTGRPLSGREAADIGLINRAVPFERLQDEVWRTADQLASIPLSQLAAMKVIVNQAYENMGLTTTQYMGQLLDGMLRNTPDALRWLDRATNDGVGEAVAERDGPFADYSQAGAGDRPDPRNVIRPGGRPPQTGG